MSVQQRFTGSIECSLIVGALAFVVGCGEAVGPDAVVSSPPPATVETDSHPTEGPHGGGLIELGNEEYHAELVHDESAGRITVYLLDSAAKSAVTTSATDLKVNLSHDGQAEQFGLAASPQAGDAPGQSSRFVSTDEELAEELDHEGVQAQLVVAIAGRQYRGAIAHDHDHEEHGH